MPDTETQTQTRTHAITVLVNNKPVTLSSHTATGAQIKAAAGLPATFKLYGPDGQEIGDQTSVHLHEHEKFTAISGQDVS